MSAGGGVGGAGAGWSPLGPLFLLPDSIAAGAAAREPITFSALSVAAAEKAVSMKAASKSHFPKRCSNELHLAGASEGFVATPKTTTRTLLYVVLFYKKKGTLLKGTSVYTRVHTHFTYTVAHLLGDNGNGLGGH